MRSAPLTDFRTDASLLAPPLAHVRGCSCALHSRRLFTGLVAAGALGAAAPGLALAQQPAAATDEGVRRDVGKESKFTKLVPAEQVEQAAAQQYAQMLKQAAQQRGLAPDSHPQVQRLRYIAQRLIPFAQPWNERSRQWRWEVNLLGSKDLNAFCMPGGKIAFYFGILAQLQLTDDEVATIMGHEIAHALREHARERMGKTAATRIGASVLSGLLGLGSAGDTLLNGRHRHHRPRHRAALVARGHEVVCFVRPQAGSAAATGARRLARLLPGATLRFGDVRRRVAGARRLRGERFDALVSCLASRTGAPEGRLGHRPPGAPAGAGRGARRPASRQVVLLSAICVQKPLLAFQQAKLAFEQALVASG
jgi:hypothetical protein